MNQMLNLNELLLLLIFFVCCKFRHKPVEALKTALEGTYAMTSDERCKVFPYPPFIYFFYSFFDKNLYFMSILCFHLIWVVRTETLF